MENRPIDAIMLMLDSDDLVDISFTLDKFWVNRGNLSKEDLALQVKPEDMYYGAVVLDKFIKDLINNKNINTVRVVKEADIVRIFNADEGKELLECKIVR